MRSTLMWNSYDDFPNKIKWIDDYYPNGLCCCNL